tara:strand:- start:5613 stop:5789 length:177 start_codon:yes stop_codon:yes gene_type:complete
MDKDTIQSIGVNAATIGISLTGVEEAIRILALCVGLIFTLYKFYITYRNEKSGFNKVK